MVVKIDTCHDKKGKICKVIFTIDQPSCLGILNFTHEFTVGYDIRTDEWNGDEICSDGWVDLDEEQIAYLVDKYDLEKLVKEVVEND